MPMLLNYTYNMCHIRATELPCVILELALESRCKYFRPNTLPKASMLHTCTKYQLPFNINASSYCKKFGDFFCCCFIYLECVHGGMTRETNWISISLRCNTGHRSKTIDFIEICEEFMAKTKVKSQFTFWSNRQSTSRIWKTQKF